MNIRRVTPADLPAFLAVMLAAGMDPRSAWNSTTVADLEKSMSGPHSGGFLALDSGGEAVGCVGFRPDPHDPHTLTLNKLATLPQVRGQGVARQLVDEVEGLAAREGFQRVLLAVSQVNLGVRPFYEGLGYRQVDEDYAYSSGKNGRPVVLAKEVAEGRWQKAEGSRAGQ
ncbi:GNAT family N-acetyltransferase [Deinococcus radiodurans]|jgi:Acetyltransferases|nr:GNAT family N-acetyltransferase [Deinococcus radiodurans]ANC72095.1 GCN5 family acetyltransferase [Deinococcus radiodurans R1 = ATCC 13939 = DSM 20539]QEM72618.1 GNAT family N-acetyltransferase [Deinococcus radiodurans]QIP28834.1 GNAT family N-acetyltransferase [Deinococcus radiodurans]QIP32460.1 GNAT family N-acetyltransferase [Deinococcus radiodurans]UDK99849.1 GNAT family N-acetyltransferase [Deinococcus radiodurans R1 = ATCC 13939 = DSM 20539]